MGNPDLVVTVTNFMAILQSIDYSKFGRCSNAADESSVKILSNLLEWKVLVVALDRIDFQFSMKAAERKHRTEDSNYIQQIEIIDNLKVPKSFQAALGNWTIKPIWWNTFSKNGMNEIRFNLLSNHLLGKSWHCMQQIV